MATTDKKAEVRPSCNEFIAFQSWVHLTRRGDDNVNILLNRTDGSQEQCSAVWTKMSQAWAVRTAAIQECLEQQKARESADMSRTERQRLYWLEDELDAEKILQDSGRQAFKGRCPGFQIPEE